MELMMILLVVAFISGILAAGNE
ncbi:uncharacterized protein METZ01_LOCUS342734 [marine metagenome]|uniref:Uncharacterized protein n=1 Tax=marine metagenome TaxID=408172 RepID=A0A382QY72_9ZZZZ